MKLLGILLFINCFFYTGAKHYNNFNFPAAVPYDTVKNKNEPLSWIDDFRSFRDAVYKDDREGTKRYFKFPLFNAGNEIWYLLLTEAENDKISGNKKFPFMEKDFDKYYTKLFPPAFKKSILKVKTNELFKTGNTGTPEMKEGKTIYKMYVTYDKELSILSLNLAYNTIFKDKDGQVLDGGESNVIYEFIVDKSRHLIFKEVRLAG